MTRGIIIILFIITVAVLFAAWKVSRRPAALPKNFLSDDDLARLDKAGFFSHVPTDQVDQVRKQVARTSWPFWVEGTRRFVLTDAENLAEGGVSSFIENLRPLLDDRGVDPGEVEDLWDRDYLVRQGGEERLIWSADEAAHERESDQPGLLWGLSTARAFGLVNRLLKDAGAKERLYAVNGGNDLQAFLLTAEQARIVSQLPGTDPTEQPYIPNEEYPRFGQPSE